MLRHKTFYIDKIEELDYCDSKILCLTGGEYEIPFTIEPSKTDHNLDNCEGCKKHHSLLVSEFEEKLNIFPNCCDGHRKLARLKEFDKKDFLKAPEWCSDKIMHSYHHFMQHIDSDEWYEEITSYFEYCIESYGSTPPQCGSPFELGNYFSCLEHLIKGNRYILKSDKFGKKQLNQRIAKIKNYLDSYYEENNQIDKNINILLSKYNEWYNLFPFELDYFEPLREQFRLSIPIFKKRKKFNKYLGSTRLEVHTVESLTNILLNTTNEIISKINGLSLYKKGDLKNPKKIELDLILQNRKLELDEIGNIDNTSRKGYIKALKTWFRTEKKFIKEITPFLKQTDSEKYPLKNLFKDPNDYEKIIDILIQKNFVEKTNNKLDWIFTQTKDYKTKQTLIALCVVLEVENYFVNSPKAVYKYIFHEFGIKIDKGTYSKSSQGFKDDYEEKHSKNYSYTILFRNIFNN